jgi:uncharacterized repeat protein (TIGR01451 family)
VVLSETLLTWTIGDLALGTTGQITLSARVNAPLANGTIVTNTASLDSDQTVAISAVATATVSSAPILSVSKENGVSAVYVGELLTYTLTYTNSGSDIATGVLLTDALPPATTYVSCSIADGECAQVSPGLVVFNVPTLTAPSTGQAWLTVQVADPLPAGTTSVINSVTMTAPSLAGPIVAQDVDVVGTQPDLAILATHSPALFSPGGVVTYFVTYGNVGRMHAQNVVITTTLPPSTTFTGSGWATTDGHIYTYTVGQLLVGQTNVQIAFPVQYEESREVGVPEFNTSFVIAANDGAGPDAAPADNSATVTIGVPDLVVTSVTVQPVALLPGVPFTFTVVVENQGTGAAIDPQSPASPIRVDIFTGTVGSHPWERYSENGIYGEVPPLAAGAVYTLVLGYEGFSELELEAIDGLYAKVDNAAIHPYGAVPEFDELNNITMALLEAVKRLYCPRVLRSAGPTAGVGARQGVFGP